jgi:chemotaxis protein methyltransferase CheR
MQASEFERFKEIVYKQSGIVLTVEKKSLLENRIRKRLGEIGVGSESEYLEIIESDLTGNELIELIDAISTNVTHFYREEAHFEFLGQLLDSLRTQDSIKIWCAAASSGEEPYTIAFECLEHVPNAASKVKILASDICTKVLKKACDGIYHTNQVSHVPKDIKNTMLVPIPENSGMLQVVSEARNLILFKRFNLVEFPYRLKGNFDIIFCRNVMIYFDQPTKNKIVNEFVRLLKPNGHLFISHTESMLGINHALEKVGNSIFKK